MKKVFLLLVITLFAFQTNAQEGFKVGAHLGLPVGDFADVSGFSIGLDAVYHWEVSETFNAGVATGFTNAFGKSIDTGFGTVEIDDVQFLPIAGSARFLASEEFKIGLDLGYAVGINEGLDSGLYYRPLVGYAISSNADINLAYTGISLDGVTLSTINLGVLFTL